MIVLNKNVIEWLKGTPIVADIVFVDPPYKLDLLAPTLQSLEINGWVHANSLIYFEHDKALEEKTLPTSWSIWRQSKAGNVYYYLAIKNE
ncbi:MAG TPA: RsmD family RNA methyltransferase, partial [Gammaproteobacteria bacterium]|nr:RsmD family RNA methyltransferase [Gammaproteobacteria bacterium]